MAERQEPSADALYWRKELAAARKREREYRDKGEKILAQYDGRTKHPFNILYSNTETMAPALYSATPIPVVDRRFKDEDPLGKAGALAGQRLLKFLLDTNLDGYDTFDETMTAVTMNALLPGRGEAIVKYDATMAQYPLKEGEEQPTEYAKTELVCCDAKPWNRVFYGYAKKWSKVPWVAFEDFIDEAEATRLFGKKLAGELTYAETDQKVESDDKQKPDTKDQGERKTTCIYQVWDKDDKTVKYISEQHHKGVLKEESDPLGLSGFFPCPKPLSFVEKTYSLIPTALYTLYETQAEELNELTRRIRNVTRAIKAKGLYDGELGGDLKNLLEADDNELVPADKGSSLAAEKGLDNAIWFMPIDRLILVLRELYTAREQCKQVIYEITGISDILRGSSKASETLGAQEIKTQWGTLRLKNKQKDVARYAKDLLRLMLELAATKFSEDTWAKMTGLPFTTTAQKKQATILMQAAQASGQPPDPQAMTILQQPFWPDVIAMLRDDVQRAYRIDIETNSTVEPEAADDHKNITELMTVISQMLNGLTPLVVQGVLPFQAAQALLLVVARRFRFGSEIEQYIQAMTPPKPPDEGKGQEQLKQQADQLKQQEQAMQERLQMQAEKLKMQHEMEVMTVEKSLLEQKLDLEVQKMKLDLQQHQTELGAQLATEKLSMRDQLHQTKVGADDKVRQMKDQGAKQQGSVIQQAASHLTNNAASLAQAVKALDAVQSQAAATQEALQQTQQLLAELLQVAKAPKRKRAIRGTDGKISEVVEEVA